MIQEHEEEKVGEGKSFRVQGRRVLLTYRTHLDKEKYIGWAKVALKNPEVAVAHETSEADTPYEHSHVLMEWEKCFQTRDPRKFDYEGIHPNVSPISTREHLMNAYKYLCKQDKTCEYLLEKRTSAFSRSVWNCKTLTEALGQVENPSQVIGTIAMWKYKPGEEIAKETLEEPRPWQKRLLDFIETKPDDRSIIWVVDTRGGAGKSRLCRYLEDEGKAIVLTGLSNPRDIAQILRGRIDRGDPTRVIIADLGRSYKDRDIYLTLEMIKNGRMDSPKYEGTSLRWNAGHVIVMANFFPEREKMTLDRWKIWEVEPPEPISPAVP